MKARNRVVLDHHCNLCATKFRRKSIFVLYCQSCREKDELFRFADCWVGA